MADQDIAKQWKSFSPERRDALLAKMTPEQKKKLRGILETPATAAAATSDNTPGFFKRYAQGVGVPSSTEELKQHPSLLETINPLATVAYKYGKNLFQEGREALKETGEAITNLREGGPVNPNVGKVGAAATQFLLRGVLGPIGGGSVHAWGEDIHSENYTGAAGDALAVLTNVLLLKGSLKPKAGVRANKIAYAADVPETMDAGRQIKEILPDLDSTAKKAPTTVGELLDNVNAASDKTNNEVGQAMFQLRGVQRTPLDISNAIKNHITPDMQQTQAGRAMANALSKAAADYQKPWTFEQLHAARVNANARLRSFFKKGPSAQYGDMKTEVGTIVDREVARGVQDIVYPQMDKVAGRPPGYFKGLLNRQGTLIQLRDALDANAKALATRTAKIKGSPRFSAENVSAYGHPATAPGISVHKLQNIAVRPNPLARANAAVARESGSFAGSRFSHSAVYSFPVRQLLLQDEESEPAKTPADAKERMRQFAPVAQ